MDFIRILNLCVQTGPDPTHLINRIRIRPTHPDLDPQPYEFPRLNNNKSRHTRKVIFQDIQFNEPFKLETIILLVNHVVSLSLSLVGWLVWMNPGHSATLDYLSMLYSTVQYQAWGNPSRRYTVRSWLSLNLYIKSYEKKYLSLLHIINKYIYI